MIRVDETVHIAFALHTNRIPFVLQNATDIYSMVTGSDYIGIVPDLIFPRYCRSYFPKADQINEFINLDYELSKIVIGAAFRYPIKRIMLD